MIIIGYPGIGKTTIAKRYPDKICDLDSSNFVITLDGSNKKPEFWYEQYVNIACKLNKNPFDIVFVSSHKEVQDEFKRRDLVKKESVHLCYPSLALKDEWIARVQKRYDESHLDKDKRALDNVIKNFDYNIHCMMTNTYFPHIVLDKTPYNLLAEILEKNTHPYPVYPDAV